MTGLAAGLALEGRPCSPLIGNFPTLRCLTDSPRNDCAYHNANVKDVCVGGGFVYAPGHESPRHRDMAFLRALPR
jgi:transketolase